MCMRNTSQLVGRRGCRRWPGRLYVVGFYGEQIASRSLINFSSRPHPEHRERTSLIRETPVQDKLMMMVWDLWDPPCIQDAIESVNSMQPVWQGEAIPVYWIDLLEEGAVNVLCCVQVLKLLLSKADEEIGELEKYLLSLQSELKWAENEEWSDLFARAFQEKIDYLDISLKSVKSAPQEDDKSCSRMTGEPADDMYEVLKKLLAGDYGRKYQPMGQLNEFTSYKTEVEPHDDARHESCLDSKSVDRASDVPLRPLGTESIPDSDFRLIHLGCANCVLH